MEEVFSAGVSGNETEALFRDALDRSVRGRHSSSFVHVVSVRVSTISLEPCATPALFQTEHRGRPTPSYARTMSRGPVDAEKRLARIERLIEEFRAARQRELLRQTMRLRRQADALARRRNPRPSPRVH